MKVRLRYLIGASVTVYAVLPLLAGVFVWGDRTGPVIYPERAHHLLYRIGYSIAGRGKPRMPLCAIFEKRPLFYGLKPRMKSEGEIKAIMDNHREPGGTDPEREARWRETLELARKRTNTKDAK